MGLMREDEEMNVLFLVEPRRAQHVEYPWHQLQPPQARELSESRKAQALPEMGALPTSWKWGKDFLPALLKWLQELRSFTCRKTPPLEIFAWLANSLAICEIPVDSWIPRPLVEFLGPVSKLVGPKTVTHGRPCSRGARKFWCCPRLRKCSGYCMQGWTTLGYRRTLGNCARKLCSEIEKTGYLP